MQTFLKLIVTVIVVVAILILNDEDRKKDKLGSTIADGCIIMAILVGIYWVVS